MTTIEALFDLYEALGGDADEISTLQTIPEVLEEISEVAGSTIELPGVSASDNGDVLTVVGGKWAKAASELPVAYPNDNGKVLTVVGGKWAKAASGPDSTTKSFTKAGLTGTVKTYGNVSTIEIYTRGGTITSTSASLGFSVPANLMYMDGISPKIPLYQDGTQVGYFVLTPGATTTISVTVSSPVSTESGAVYANFTTL